MQEFENNKLKNVKNDQEDWINDLEGLRTDIELINEDSEISEKEFMVKILNNFPAGYDIVLHGCESSLDKDLTIGHIYEILNNFFACIKKNDAENIEKALELLNAI